jgi:hypothetical protein
MGSDANCLQSQNEGKMLRVEPGSGENLTRIAAGYM